jgi:hypothetical protein
MKHKDLIILISGFGLALNGLAQNAPPSGNAGASTEFIGEAQPPGGKLSLWYRQPAVAWTEALAIGNGRLGAMVFGGIGRERLQLNEDTLWAGGPYDPVNTNALEALPEVRQLIFDGKYDQADRLTSSRLMAKCPTKRSATCISIFPAPKPWQTTDVPWTWIPLSPPSIIWSEESLLHGKFSPVRWIR